MAAQDMSERIITMSIAAGTTDVSLHVPMVDITDGFTAETGLTPTNFDIAYARPHIATVKADAVALATPQFDDPHLDNAVFEVDSTNLKGIYRVDLPDAIFATGEENALVTITESNCRTVVIHIQLQNMLSTQLADPTTVATNINEMIIQLWRRFFKKNTQTATQHKTYKNDNTTVVTTQTVSDDDTTQTMGAAS